MWFPSQFARRGKQKLCDASFSKNLLQVYVPKADCPSLSLCVNQVEKKVVRDILNHFEPCAEPDPADHIDPRYMNN
jgi:hypothetical protein